MLNGLRYWRVVKAYTIEELAKEAQVDFSTISLIENGHRNPQPRTVRKLAKALGVTPEDLYADPPVDPKTDAGQAETIPAPAEAGAIAVTGLAPALL